jgi:hypothetical protein
MVVIVAIQGIAIGKANPAVSHDPPQHLLEIAGIRDSDDVVIAVLGATERLQGSGARGQHRAIAQ